MGPDPPVVTGLLPADQPTLGTDTRTSVEQTEQRSHCLLQGQGDHLQRTRWREKPWGARAPQAWHHTGCTVPMPYIPKTTATIPSSSLPKQAQELLISQDGGKEY